nr:sugar transferase [Bacteroidales bacterium]
PFCCFLAIWVLTSALTGKYDFQGKKSLKKKLTSVFTANISIVAITLTLLTLLEITGYSRLMVFGTVGISTIFEIILIWQLIAYQKINRFFFYEGKTKERIQVIEDHYENARIKEDFSTSVKHGIVKLINLDVYTFIKKGIPNEEEDIYFTSTRQTFNIENKIGHHKAIVNLQTLNTVNKINSLFFASNQQLPMGGLYFSIAETISTRKKKILTRYPIVINQIIYAFDYLYSRVFAKMYPTRFIYRSLNHNNRAISKTELLGRLYAAGFEVVKEDNIDGKYVCITKKISNPKKIDHEAIGGLIKLKRLGKNGKIIGVYKFRTMHPYSEYIQAYIYEKNNLQEGGKFKEDFRINHIGRLMRKMWIDELPMILNLMKGEMKIVGVRPLSQHYFSLYTKELQDLRITTKPGLLPPFYADSPVTLEEIIESELRYLYAYKKHPLTTDINYFFKILYNILIKKRRSN